MSLSARVVILVRCLQGRWCVATSTLALQLQDNPGTPWKMVDCNAAGRTPSQSPVVDLSMRLQASFLLSVVQGMHKVAHT